MCDTLNQGGLVLDSREWDGFTVSVLACLCNVTVKKDTLRQCAPWSVADTLVGACVLGWYE